MNPADKVETAHAELAEFLFRKDDAPVFALLDGASAPGLVKALYQHEPEYCCLQRGELAPDAAVVAPYLARLEAESEFAAWLLAEGWGAHWGSFLTSGADLRTLRNHFRDFLKAELPNGRTVLFRYYDPRVLRNFLPVCNPAELEIFLGPVKSFTVEGETPENGVRFSLAGKALKAEPFQLKPAQEA